MTNRIGHDFMRLTRYPSLDESEQSKALPQPPLEVAPDPETPLIPLPNPDEVQLPLVNLLTLIGTRTSVREYAPEPISLAKLGLLLWCTQGVKKQVDTRATFRTVPSAGARHAFETYLLVNRVEGLDPGLYRFLALEYALQPVALDNPTEAITEACLNQGMVRTSAVTFLWAADAHRMTWRYGERGFRYLHLDAGHVCQNLYLAAEAIDCGSCAIAAFDDDALNTALGLDGEEQFAVYVATVGRKR
ncbi:MAG: SagB/ThcOx family dehydrogenase [Armatimonadota bacterium]